MIDISTPPWAWVCPESECFYHATSAENLEAHKIRAHGIESPAWKPEVEGKLEELRLHIQDIELAFTRMIDAAKMMLQTDNMLREQVQSLVTEVAVVIERMDEMEERENARQV